MSNLVEHDLDPEEMEQEEDAFDSSSQGSSSQTSTITWINWYTSLPGHDYFCEVHEDFIDDDFNLTGLQSMVPFWKEALDMVLDVEPDEDFSKIPDVSIVENSAELLYGLVHQRFILTKAGLQAMADKYEMAHFGVCPRVFCQSAHVIPCGRADMPGVDTVKLACPNCGDIYVPPSSKYAGLDGAFFGTTFAPLFFQTYPELLSAPFCPAQSTSSSSVPGAGGADSRASPAPSHPSTPGGPGPTSAPIGGETFTNPNPHGGQRVADGRVYIPRIYGFKVSERARSGPRMRWLRERPERAQELDGVDYKGRFIGQSQVQGHGPSQGNAGEEVQTLREQRDREAASASASAAAAAAAAVKGQGQGQGEGKMFTMGGAGEGKLFDDDDDDDSGRAGRSGVPMPPAQAQVQLQAKVQAQAGGRGAQAGAGAKEEEGDEDEVEEEDEVEPAQAR